MNNRFLKNWIYLLFSDLSNTIINFLIFMMLARRLNPEGYGLLTNILAIATLFSVFSNNLVSNHVITREVTVHPQSTNSYFKLIIPIRLISIIGTYITMLVYLLIDGTSDSFILVFSGVLLFGNTIWDLSESIAFGHFATKFTTILNIIFSLIWLCTVLILPNNLTIVQFVFPLYAFIYGIRGISYFGIIKKNFIKDNLEPINHTYKSIVSMSLPYLWMRSLGAFTEQIPIIMLNTFSGAVQVGYFAVGNRFVIPITLGISTALRAIFPFVTKLYIENKVEFDNRIKDGFIFVLVWGSLIAITLVTTSFIWLPILVGKNYIDSVYTFNLVAWFGVGMCFDLLLSTILSSTYQQRTLAIITTIDFVIMLPLFYIGSKYGASGLAFCKLIGIILALSYHIGIVCIVLKINLMNRGFIYAVLFYLALMISSLVIFNFVKKLIILVIIVILFTVIKDSPIRNSLMIAKDYIFKMKNAKA